MSRTGKHFNKPMKSEGEHTKKLLKTTKAVSKVIGILTIIIVFIITGSIFYSYTTAYVGSMKTNFQTQMEQLLIDAVDINSTHIIASMKNNGVMDAKVTDAQVDDMANILLQGVMIAGQSIGTTYLIEMYAKGVSYVVSMVFSLDTSLTFSVMYYQKSKYPTETSYAQSVQWTVYEHVKLSPFSPKQTNIPGHTLHTPQNMFFQTS